LQQVAVAGDDAGRLGAGGQFEELIVLGIATFRLAGVWWTSARSGLSGPARKGVSVAPGLAEIEKFGLRGVQERVADEGGGVEDFEADEFAAGVEFGGDVGAEFDASRLRFVGDGERKDIVFLEICHARLTHS
jgi:hypothetical protein